jgi:putative cardiolipin synthase
MNRIFISLVFFSVSSLSCNTVSKVNLRSGRMQGAENATSIPEPTSTASTSPQPNASPNPSDAPDDDLTIPNTSNRQFRVLDPGYDYNTKDSLSAKDMAARHPVYLSTTSQVAVLANPTEYYQARMHLLNQATRSVRIQALLFASDESGRRVTEKLVELVKKGIQVTVIVDPLVNYEPRDQQLYQYLKGNGIRVEGFEFLYLNYLKYLKKQNDFGVTISDTNMRYHEKLFIIDGELADKGRAITGGVNIGNEYFGVNLEEPIYHWWDKDVVVKGAVVANITNAFDVNVQTFEAERLTNANSNMGLLWTLLSAALGSKIKPPTADRPQISARLDTLEKTPLELTWHSVDIRSLHSRPRFKEDLIYTAYLDFVERSRKEIQIFNSYFVAEDDLIAALIRAAKRGVKVSIMTNSDKTLDVVNLATVARASYKQLLEGNDNNTSGGSLKIYEWGGEASLHNGWGQNHAKFAVFDRKAAIIGGFNLDPRSHYLNAENVVAFEGKAGVLPLATELDTFVDPKYSIEITRQQAAEYAKPGSINESLKVQFLSMFKGYL